MHPRTNSRAVAETSETRPPKSGGSIVTEDGGGLSVMDEAPGSRANYSVDAEGESAYNVTFDNGSKPGFTVVGVEGMDQDNLLMDVTTSFFEMGIRFDKHVLTPFQIRVVPNEADLGMPMTLLAGNVYSVAAFIECSSL